MKNLNSFVSMGLILAMSTGGCATLGKIFSHERHEITVSDAKKIHPRSDLSHHHIRLTTEQAQAINQRYGQSVAAEGDVITYYKARPRKGIYGEGGNIFLVQVKDSQTSLEILVCTTAGRVDEILIKDSSLSDDKPLVPPDEFIKQFIGRSLRDSWEVAQNASDLVTLPSKIRPITVQPRTSEEISGSIRKVLVWAEVLHIK